MSALCAMRKLQVAVFSESMYIIIKSVENIFLISSVTSLAIFHLKWKISGKIFCS